MTDYFANLFDFYFWPIAIVVVALVFFALWVIARESVPGREYVMLKYPRARAMRLYEVRRGTLLFNKQWAIFSAGPLPDNHLADGPSERKAWRNAARRIEEQEGEICQ